MAAVIALTHGGVGCMRKPHGEPASPSLEFTSPTVDLAMAFGDNDAREVRLAGALATRARLRVVSIVPAGPEATVLTGEGGGAPGLRLGMTGTRVGREAGQVVVATGLTEPRELTLLYSWRVLGNLTVDPTNPFIDLGATASNGLTIHVSSRRGDFRLTDAYVTDGPFAARIPDDAPASVVVRVGASDAGSGQRGFLGTLRLVSNDPAEPQKDVPLFALGPLPTEGGRKLDTKRAPYVPRSVGPPAGGATERVRPGHANDTN